MDHKTTLIYVAYAILALVIAHIINIALDGLFGDKMKDKIVEKMAKE